MRGFLEGESQNFREARKIKDQLIEKGCGGVEELLMNELGRQQQQGSPSEEQNERDLIEI